MENDSLESSSSLVMTTLKAAKGRVFAGRSAGLLSGTASVKPAVLRTLKARFLEGLTPSDLKSVLAVAKYQSALAP